MSAKGCFVKKTQKSPRVARITIRLEEDLDRDIRREAAARFVDVAVVIRERLRFNAEQKPQAAAA